MWTTVAADRKYSRCTQENCISKLQSFTQSDRPHLGLKEKYFDFDVCVCTDSTVDKVARKVLHSFW